MGYSVPNVEGKTFVVTGANTGIGRVTAVELARAGGDVILACRSRERTQPVIDEIETLQAGAADFVALDLASLDSVREAAAEIIALNRPLDVLINNAGLAGQQGETKEGFELAFGVNHLGHYLLTRLLLDALLQNVPARIVNVASRAHYQADGIDFDALRQPTQTTTGLDEYAVSKLANVLFTKELAKRYTSEGINSYSLHPGVVATDIWRRLPGPLAWIAKRFMISPTDGAATTLYCATSPDVAGESGHYYDSCKQKKPSRIARHDDGLAEKLWDKSAEWTGLEP